MVGAVAAIVAVALAVTGPVVVIGAPTSTEPGALRIEPLPDGEFAVFYLPPDAPLAELPLPETPGNPQCTPAMMDWLGEHGVKWATFRMSVRNSADTGPMLTIDNVRVVDKKKITPRPGFIFECGDQGTGETALLDLDLDRDEPAVLVDYDHEDGKRPFAFNLAPGEQGDIELQLALTVDGYSGRVVADVTGGGSTEQVELPLGSFESPGLGRSHGFSVSLSPSPGVFYCPLPDGHDDPDECDPDEIRSFVTEMWK